MNVSGPRPQGPDGDNSQERRTSFGTGTGSGNIVSRYPDSQQLFVGNLLPEVKEEELKQHFECEFE